MRVLFAAPPFAGHLNGLVPLAEAARAAGHECRFVTGHAKLAALGARGLEAAAPRSLPPGALERIAEGNGRIHGRPWRMLAQLRENASLLPALTDDLAAILRDWGADVLVADSVAAMAGPAAARVGVPWITTLATPFALETRHGTPAFMGGWRPPRGAAGRARDAAGRCLTRLGKRAALRLVRRGLCGLIDSPYRPDGSETVYSERAILGFGMRELEFPRDWPPQFEMIGPVFGGLEPAPLLELPVAERLVLVSLGTHLPWARAGWERDLGRLAARFPRWQFVLSRGGRGPSERLAPNVHAVPLVSYARDLPRFDAVIHHGGAGITSAAIVAGRPSLVVPQDYDQFDYAARIAHHGLGLRARSLRGAEAALAHVASGDWPSLERFRAAAARYRPEERFLAALEAAAR